jgi:RNA polymerase sigma factor (sigma-70 family)
MTDSNTLLSQYARTGSESAFRELVSRYIDLVFSTAFRLVDGDVESAQDVVQTVFVALADQARTLPEDVMLGGWLHLRTRFAAGKLMRTERRRQLRERQAAEMNAIEDHSESNLAQVAPVLDEAIGQLNAEDRNAILLRFFERKDFRSVGNALGSSEEAARKRVDRALEKLHVLLTHRGATLSAAALGTALATEAVTAAPAGLATCVSGIALASAAASGGMTPILVKLMTMTKLTLGAISVIAVACLTVRLVIQHQSQARLREENQALREQTSHLAQMATENEHLSTPVARAKSAESLPREQMSELLRLRDEATRLRGELLELASSARIASTTPAATGESRTDAPVNQINFTNADLEQVLAVYGMLAGAELQVTQGVRMPRAYITITNGQNLTQTKALRLIEQALREQAGLVVDEHFVVKPDDRARATK